MIVRLVLGPEQTAEIIAQAGGDRATGRVFAVLGPGSWPDSAGRLNAYFVECPSVEAADAAVRVARGLSREAKPRKARK